MKHSEGGTTDNKESFWSQYNFVEEIKESNQVRQSQELKGFLKLQKPNQTKPNRNP